MGKKKNDDNLKYFAVVVLVVLAFYGIGQGWFVKFGVGPNAITPPPDDGGGSGGGTPPAAPAPKIDISELMSPYMATTDFQATCMMHGGEFRNTAVDVGCYNMMVPIDVEWTCKSVAVLTANTQCRAVGAQPICELMNIGCRYV